MGHYQSFLKEGYLIRTCNHRPVNSYHISLRTVRHKPWACRLSMEEPSLDNLLCFVVVPGQKVVHVQLRWGPRLTLPGKMEVLNFWEVFAHWKPEAELAVAVKVFRVERSVHLWQDKDFALARELLVQDVHVKVLKNIAFMGNPLCPVKYTKITLWMSYCFSCCSRLTFEFQHATIVHAIKRLWLKWAFHESYDPQCAVGRALEHGPQLP